jgi:hypothetical protein
MDHPNGALGVTEIVLVHPQPESLAAVYVRLLGGNNVGTDRDGLTARCGSALFRILSPTGAVGRFPRIALPTIPPEGCLIGATVAVASLPEVTAILDRNGIATSTSAFGGVVPVNGAANGVILEFQET